MPYFVQGTGPCAQYDADGNIRWKFDYQVGGWASSKTVIQLTDDIGAELVALGGIETDVDGTPI
jgi:hypothetical protein